jgi:malonate-semialdehyde dehydrogenase (acetylating)/methylmalonate-semialdehyde dehydrogenase
MAVRQGFVGLRALRYVASKTDLMCEAAIRPAPTDFDRLVQSFFGDLHGQGRDALEFFTRQKVVVERWPAAWSRRF